MLVVLVVGLIYGFIYDWRLWQFVLLGILSFNQLVLFSLLSGEKYSTFERVSLANASLQLVLIIPLAVYPEIELLILSRILSPIISWIIVRREMEIHFKLKKTGYLVSFLRTQPYCYFHFLDIF